MTLAYGHIAQRMFNTPLAYDPRKAEAFVGGLGGRITGSEVIVVNGGQPVDHTAFANGRPSAGILGSMSERAAVQYGYSALQMEGSVAVIPIEGTLVNKGTFIGQSSGVTSYEGIRYQVARAAASPDVKGVVFEIDSFGGECAGMFEAASDIAALSKLKPTCAILTDWAYSAAYCLASQARSIIAPQFGGAGSIGVIMLHADYSGMLEKEGIKVTIIKAGAKKADGNPYEELPAEVLDKWQSEANLIRDQFAAVVAKGRNGSLTKAKALATEAEAFTASEALSLGLIDAIADPSAAFAAFVKEINRS